MSRCTDCGAETARPHPFEGRDGKPIGRLCDRCCPRCWGGPGRTREGVAAGG